MWTRQGNVDKLAELLLRKLCDMSQERNRRMFSAESEASH